MVRPAFLTRPVPAAAPWILAGAALLLFLLWVWLPARPSLVARVPGADRPAGTEVGGGESENVFARGKLVTGPGRPANLAGFWPQFRGPGMDGIARDPAPMARAWPGGKPRELWRVEVGEGFAGPAVEGGRVFLMDYDRAASRDAVRCLSLADGAEIWRYSYPVAVKRNHGLTRTVPAVARGRVVSMGPKCHVTVLGSDTGEFRWGIDLVKDHGTTVPPWYTGQCPLVDGELVILAPGGPEALLMAVDLENGGVRWRTPNAHDWKMTHSSVAVLELGGRRYYLYCASGGVVAVDAASGAPAWETATWKINIATVPTPVNLGDGKVFFTGGYNAGSALFQFRLQDGKLTGEEIFRVKATVFGATQHSPIWHGGHLYGIRADGRFVCLGADGKVVWASPPGPNFGLGPLLAAGDAIFALNDRGRLTLLEASPAGYQPVAEADVLDGHECWAPMALAGDRLLVRDLTRMLCLQVGP